MMAADYRHIGGRENRLGRHYSRFSPFLPAAAPAVSCDKRDEVTGGVNPGRANPRRQGGGAQPHRRRSAASRDARCRAGGRSRAPGSSQAPENRSAPSRARQRWQQAGSSAAVDPLSARRLGDKKIFKIHPGPAAPSREPGVEQGKTGGLAVEKGERRLELP